MIKTYTKFTLDSLGINSQTSSLEELSAVFGQGDEANLTEKTIEIILDRFPDFFDNKKNSCIRFRHYPFFF